MSDRATSGWPRPLRVALCLAALAAILPLPAASAQVWAGLSGLAVELRDGAGHPVSDASVVLGFLDAPGHGGPPARVTDSAGRVEFPALAAGRWIVSVRHPGFLGYDARVLLEPGRKPREDRAMQVASGDAQERLKLRYEALEGPLRAGAGRRPSDRADRGTRAAPTSAPATADADARPAASPATGGALRSSRDGSCIECRSGEWALTATGEPRPADGGSCPASLRPVAAAIAGRFSTPSGATGELAALAAPVLPLDPSGPALPSLDGVLGQLTEPVTGACQALAVKLPRGATFKGFQLEIETAGGVLPCPPDQDCPEGAGRWAGLPATEDSPAGKIVAAAFAPAAGAAAVRPRLTVYFLPAADWLPDG